MSFNKKFILDRVFEVWTHLPFSDLLLEEFFLLLLIFFLISLMTEISFSFRFTQPIGSVSGKRAPARCLFGPILDRGFVGLVKVKELR